MSLFADFWRKNDIFIFFKYKFPLFSFLGGDLEKLFRHIGFIKYGHSLSLWNTALHIAPEVIAIFSSFFVYVFCDRLNPACPDSEQIQEGLLASIIRTPESGREVRRSLMKKKGLLALAIVGRWWKFYSYEPYNLWLELV